MWIGFAMRLGSREVRNAANRRGSMARKEIPERKQGGTYFRKENRTRDTYFRKFVTHAPPARFDAACFVVRDQLLGSRFGAYPGERILRQRPTRSLSHVTPDSKIKIECMELYVRQDQLHT